MVEAISNRPHNIDGVLSRLAGIKKQGTGHVADCPVPGHRTPAGHLTVRDGGDKALIRCHGRDHTYQEICKALDFETLSYSTNGSKPARTAKLNDAEAIELMKKIYGLTDETIKYFGIRPNCGRQAWKYAVKGGTRFKKYVRTPPKKYWHTAGTPNQLYGRIPKGTTEIWLLNGEPAVWVGYQAGIPVVCGLYGEGKLPEDTAQLLREKGVQTINLPYDLDIPGRKAALDILAGPVADFTVKLRRLPDVLGEHGDICDLYNLCGRDNEAFRQVLMELPEVEIDALVAELPNKSGLPEIMVTDRQLRDITSDALAALYRVNDPPQVFRQSGTLSRIRMDEKATPFIEALSESALRGLLTRACDFFETTRKEDIKAISPPLDMVRDCLTLGDWQFPALLGITEAPVIRSDGTVIRMPGYDSATSLYYYPSPKLSVPPIPDKPTSSEVKTAIELALEPVCNFPFDTDASRANAIATILMPILRPMIDGSVPLAIIDKPQPGTGASLLAEVISVIATGRAAAMMTACKDDEEWRKAITSLLLRGQLVVTIDNIEGTLYAPSLAVVLTATTYQDRILGRSEMVTLPNRTTWIGTGNNIKLAGDLPRRCIWVRMDAKMARPWQRDVKRFKHPRLIEWVSKNRGGILAAILTIGRAWVVADKPEAQGLPNLGGYESYCRIVGGVLAYMGVSGFLANLDAMYDEVDTETPQWEGFLETWHDAIGDKALTAADLINHLNDNVQLRAALPDIIADTSTQNYIRRLGNALAKKKGVRFPNGFSVVKSGEYRRAATWQVVSLQKADSHQISFKCESNYAAVLGMPVNDAIEVWQSAGAPVIHLSQGVNCLDLGKLLSRTDVSPEHLGAVRAWLQGNKGGDQ